MAEMLLGALLAIAGGALTSWLTHRFGLTAQRDAEKARLQKLMGQALFILSEADGHEAGSAEFEKWSASINKILQTGGPHEAEKLAGYFESLLPHLGALATRISESTKMIRGLEAETRELEAKKHDLEAEARHLQAQKAELKAERRRLDQAEPVLRAELAELEAREKELEGQRPIEPPAHD